MPEEVKAPEAPAVEPVKAPEKVESLIDNRRSEIEKIVQGESEKSEVPETPKAEQKPAEPTPPEDPVAKIKQSVQKRIDKVVAQKKTLEEELAEAKAEIERLKALKEQVPPDDKPPTVEQVEAYIVKMREEGNVKEEVAAMRYLVKLEKEQALKEVRETQTKAQTEAQAKKTQEQLAWADLCRDYEVYTPDGKPDEKSDLRLANTNSLLYKTALSLYNDKELHADFYNDPNLINGFRRAVADAYREIHQQGLLKTTPKGEEIAVLVRTPKVSLADPSATETEDVSGSVNLNTLSDADKVREEIKNRKKNRCIRKLS